LHPIESQDDFPAEILRIQVSSGWFEGILGFVYGFLDASEGSLSIWPALPQI
jgi:hypothetical protein